MAAQCDVVCTCLPGPPEMEAVYLGPGGVMEGIKDGGICVDHTTNSPDSVRKVGGAISERGGSLLDAPMDGGRESSLGGNMTLFVGGDEEVLDRARPVLDCYAANVVLVGELGTGSVTKIVHNALANSIDLLVAECMTLGVKAGVHNAEPGKRVQPRVHCEPEFDLHPTYASHLIQRATSPPGSL